MKLSDEIRHEQVTTGEMIWEADGRKRRPDNVTYRESLDATYQGPLSGGKLINQDGLIGNNPGMIGNDPVRGFDLTMPAGQATSAGYTTRDFASAPHGVDYQPHFADWEENRTRHPNLVMPGRTLVFSGVRMDALALGDDLMGTAGCIVQDWVGLDFPTIEKHGSSKQCYTGGGFVWLPPLSSFGRSARKLGRAGRSTPFGHPIPGVAPVLVMMVRMKGWGVMGRIWLDPAEPHEFVIHWTPDAQALEMYADGVLITRVEQGRPALPLGTQTRGRIDFHRSGLHACCWHDNNNGGLDVQGYDGNPDDDQVFTIERVRIIET